MKVRSQKKSKKAPKVKLELSGGTIYASIGGTNVGTLETEDYDDESYLMIGINVNDAYRRQGIASKMIQYAVELWDDEFKIMNYPRTSSSDGEEYLTHDGANLVLSCYKREIITGDNLLTSRYDYRPPVVGGLKTVTQEDDDYYDDYQGYDEEYTPPDEGDFSPNYEVLFSPSPENTKKSSPKLTDSGKDSEKNNGSDKQSSVSPK